MRTAAGWTARHAAAAIGGGLVAGAVAGVAARLVMYLIRVSNSSYNGAVTHVGFVNGRWTLSGTLNIVGQGAVIGAFGGIVYLLLRPLLRGRDAMRGVEFGVLALVAGGALVFDDSYEFVRFVSTWIAVAAFAALYPLYGLVLGVVAGRLAPAPAQHHWPLASAIASVALAVVIVARAAVFADYLRFRYFS